MTVRPFHPDYALCPGVTLKEMLDDRGMSQSELAARTELSEKTVSQISNGAAPITIETAAKLEMATGVPASFWNSRETRYRSALLLREEQSKLSELADWLQSISIRQLIDREYVDDTKDKGQLVHQVLKFFGVTSVAAWNEIWLKPQLQFRGSKAHNNYPGFVATWVRMGEISAANIECAPFDEKAFKATVQEIRALTTLPASEAIRPAVDLWARCGVALVLIREIPKASVSGVAKWLSKDKAVIMLSLKYKTDDQFWFSLFHEAAHILLHGKKQIFVDDRMNEDSPEEREANKFAREMLIPARYNHQLPRLKTKNDIRLFAESIGVSPGIVVGRLQKDEFLSRDHCNDLKTRYEWA